MVDDNVRKRRVNPALLLGDNAGVDVPGLVESGEFDSRKVRSFRGEGLLGDGDEVDVVELARLRRLREGKKDEVRVPVVPEGEGVLGKPEPVVVEPVVENVEPVAPAPERVVSEVGVSSEVDVVELARLRRLKAGKVNPLFNDDKGGGEVSSVKKVNPMFALEENPTRPDLLGVPKHGGVRVEPVGDGEGGVSDLRRKLFVEKPDAKPRSAYTKRAPAAVGSGEWDEEVKVDSRDRGVRGDVKGFHFTERDAILMRFMVRYRYAFVDQLARLVDTTPRNVSARLRVLEKRGLVRKETLISGLALWTTRKAGNLLIDSGFREIKKGNISLATIKHTIGLGSLGVEFEREKGGLDLLGEGKGVVNWVAPSNRWKFGIVGHAAGKFPGEMTVTEREIRQGQTRWRGTRDTDEMRGVVEAAVRNVSGPEMEEGNEGLFVVYGLTGGEHIPDFVIVRERNSSGGVENIAVELELTEKTNAEWRKILRNYRDNGSMFKKVYYFTDKKPIAKALTKIAEDEGMGDRVVLRKYDSSNERIPFW